MNWKGRGSQALRSIMDIKALDVSMYKVFEQSERKQSSNKSIKFEFESTTISFMHFTHYFLFYKWKIHVKLWPDCQTSFLCVTKAVHWRRADRGFERKIGFFILWIWLTCLLNERHQFFFLHCQRSAHLVLYMSFWFVNKSCPFKSLNPC